jgi:tetratricopeptide (TPR) repeat protein
MDGTNFNKRAKDLFDKAEKTVKGSFFGNLMRGKQDRADDAKDLYLQAANCYKLSNDFQNALMCYEKCIESEESEADAASHYREAALCIKEHDTDKYVSLIKKAIDLYALSGRSSTGATMSRDCA